MSRPDPFSYARALRCVSVALATLCAVTCATPPPEGPPFEALSAPHLGESLVYLFRADRTRASGDLLLRLDGQPLEALSNGQFEALRLSPGRHTLSMTLRTARFLPTAWNELAFCAEESGTAFIRIYAAYTELEGHGDQSRSAEIPGTSNRRVGITVLAARESKARALPDLSESRRAGWSASTRQRTWTGAPAAGFGAGACKAGRGGGI